MKKPINNKKVFFAALLTVFGSAVVATTLWLLYSYADIEVDQIIFQLKAPANGLSFSLALLIFVFIVTGTAVFSGLVILIYNLFAGKLKWKITKEKTQKRVRKLSLVLAILYFCSTLCFFVFSVGVDKYLADEITNSEFFERNYVDKDTAEIVFPESKRNLIYIFAESMETSYFDKANGGDKDYNCIKELTSLAKENISFSNTDTLGGAYCTTGSSWTASAMVSQTSGVTVKVPLNAQNFGGQNRFMPGVKTLGEILSGAGYNQTLLIGSDAEFAGRDSYFSEHGNYNIIDYTRIIKEGRLPSDYYEFWGFEDEKLFAFAKEELLRLSEEEAPFNLTMLTVDTHFPDGYKCDECENEYPTQYENALACSSKRISEFVNWCKEQSFYENTTIVIVGDHLTMDADYMHSIDENYERRVYNCFINSAVSTDNVKRRTFTTLDFFPTTLASLGVRIKGDRLGLGTNLFSDTETLTEKYGIDYFEAEIQKNSDYYNREIIGIDN